MKHRLIITILLLGFVSFICAVQSGKTAVLPPNTTISITNWHTLSGPTGGSIADIVLSPAYPSPETLFAGLRGQGVYRSDDGAYNWQATGSGDWIVRDLAISPSFTSDETLFALSGVWPTGYTVHRTTDGGQVWQASSSPTSFAAGRRLAISPDFANDQLLYLVTGIANTTFISTDSGDTFTQAVGWFDTHHVNELVFSPAFATDHTLFVLVANDGIYRSTDSGSNWLPVETSRGYTALAVSPNYAVDETITAVSTTGTIYTSTDDGATWNPGTGITLGTGGEITLAFSPTFNVDQVIMAASSTDTSSARSLDRGVTWTAVGAYDPTQSYKDGMIGGDVYAIALAPEQDWDGVQFAATSSGIARSPYRGDSWLQMNDGLPRLSGRSLALAPGNPDIMLAGTEFYETRYFDSGATIPGDGNVQWSQDGGETWRHVTGRLGRVNDVAFSPDFVNDETAFAVSGMIGQHGLVEGGIYRSVDNSETWTSVFTPTFHSFQTLAVSPNFAIDETVWASANSYSSAIGLYESTNGGDNWTNIAPNLNIHLLNVSPNYVVDQTLFAGMGGDGVHRSLDGGVTWTRVLSTPYVTALTISPAYGASRTLYAAARADLLGVTAVSRSTDNGDSWQELNTSIPTEQDGANRNISALSFAVDGTVLAGVQYGESGEATYVYRSSDGGESWQMVDTNFAAAKLYDFATTPTGSFYIFAATDTGLHQTTITQGAAAESGLWTSYGPRGIKANALAMSPDFDNDGVAFSGEWFTSYMGSESGSGMVKSTDSGQNWIVSASGAEAYDYTTAIHDYAFSPAFATDQTVFAATWGGLMQSADGGQNWVRNEALYGGPPGTITRVAVSPDLPTSGHIMTAGGYGGLFISADGGLTWNTPPSASDFVSEMAYSPNFAIDQTAYTASFSGVDKTEDFGISWTAVFSDGVHTIAVSPDYVNDETVLAASNVLHLSENGGSSWISRTIDAAVTTVWSLALSPQFASDGVVFAGTNVGLFYSADVGQTWTTVSGYENDTILSLAISPSWPTQPVLLVGTQKGVYRLLSVDATTGELKQLTNGGSQIRSTVMDFADDEALLFTGTSNHGVYAGANGATSWLPIGLQGGSGYFAINAVASSPNFSSDQTLFATWASNTGIGGDLRRTTDGGETWTTVYSSDLVADVAVSPDFANDGTVWASGNYARLQRSIDGGATFTQLVTWPPAGTSAHALQIELPPTYGGNGRFFVGSDDGVWWTPDDGTTWNRSASGLAGGQYVTALKASPNYAVDQTLLATATWSSGSPDYFQYQAVFRSTDGGVSWLQVMNGLPPDTEWKDVSFSPNFVTDLTAYVISDQSLYRSLDGGESWTFVGEPSEQPHLLHLLVDSQGKVFVSSDTGVWRYGTVAQNVIVNGRFESNSVWDLPVTAIPADYNTQIVYNGERSMRVGLNNGVHVNGYSSARQTFTLPDEPLLAQLTFYLYPVTGDETAAIATSAPENALTHANVPIDGDA